MMVGSSLSQETCDMDLHTGNKVIFVAGLSYAIPLFLTSCCKSTFFPLLEALWKITYILSLHSEMGTMYIDKTVQLFLNSTYPSTS